VSIRPDFDVKIFVPLAYKNRPYLGSICNS